VKQNLKEGDGVRLVTPENLRLNGAPAVVERVTDWGAHVACAAAASGHFRALWEEMTPAGNELVSQAVVQDTDTPYGLQTNGKLTLTARAKASGCSGDVCDKCGSFNMVRAGACLCCLDCGSTTGCG
jgi:hypothetical protein